MTERDPAFWTKLILAAFVPAVVTAFLLFLVFDLRTRNAVLDHETYRNQVEAEANHVHRDASTHTGCIPVTSYITADDRLRLDAMDVREHTLRRQRDFSREFAVDGGIFSCALGAFWLGLALRRASASSSPPPTRTPMR